MGWGCRRSPALDPSVDVLLADAVDMTEVHQESALPNTSALAPLVCVIYMSPVHAFAVRQRACDVLTA